MDYIYAGDMKGNLWKFDLTAASNTGWKIANGGSPDVRRHRRQQQPPADHRRPGLAREPATGKRWIFIGTGKFMETSDVLDMSVQSMHGIVDDDSAVTGRTSGGDGDLQKRSIVVAGTVDGNLVRGFEANGTLDTTKMGWYIDLLLLPSGTPKASASPTARWSMAPC